MILGLTNKPEAQHVKKETLNTIQGKVWHLLWQCKTLPHSMTI